MYGLVKGEGTNGASAGASASLIQGSNSNIIFNTQVSENIPNGIVPQGLLFIINEGYLRPNHSIIRLMWNFGREDEHYLVLKDGKLKGLELPAHSGREGVHDYKKILNGVCFEAQYLKNRE